MEDAISIGEEKNIAYDLRIFYAAILGKKMLKIEDYQEKRDFPNWFRYLQLMFPVVLARVDKDRSNVKIKYKEKINKCLKVINENQRVYLKRDFNAKGMTHVEDSLLDLQHFIYRVMDKNKLFGDNINLKGL